jgi:hypothetical protein
MSSDAYTDDPSIGDSMRLWRRIPPWHFVYDANLQRWRPSSSAFDNDPDGHPMSVILEEMVLKVKRDANAGLVRASGQIIARDPRPEEPAHALVIGTKPKSIQRRLAKESIWVIAPPAVR